VKIWVPALALLALSACGKPEELLENSIRTELSKQGEVREIDMTPDGDDRLNGFAILKGPQGDSRLSCKATRKNDTEYDWQCNQMIDETVLTGMENVLRQQLEAQDFTVLEMDMQKDGEDRMKGHALLRAQDGEEGRLTCSAERAGTAFQGECHVPSEAAAG
jgi:hypothetical protein